jgi:hypothetical protein
MIKTFMQIFPQWPGSATATTTLNVTANGNTIEYYEFASYERAILTVEVSAVTGTTPTLDLYIEERNAGTGNWTQIDKFKQLTTTTSSPVRRVLNASAVPASYPASGDGSAGDATTSPFGECLRLRWVVGGSSPNFTFTCSATLISPPTPVNN